MYIYLKFSFMKCILNVCVVLLHLNLVANKLLLKDGNLQADKNHGSLKPNTTVNAELSILLWLEVTGRCKEGK